MRICLLSEYSGKVDEGMRNTAFYFENKLSQNHEVLHLCILPATNLLSILFWQKLFSFKPHIINLIPGPSLKALALLKFLKIRFPKTKTVVLGSHPFFSQLSRRLIPLVKPDLVLTPYRVEDPTFSNTGCHTRFLPNGIDLDKFTSPSTQEKRHLRQQYGLDEHKFIALHVGSVDKERNVLFLNRLQQINGTQVVVVGSTSLPLEPEVYAALIKGGCVVRREYFPNVAEIYQLADCYVFPTNHWRKGMELPVSVLEAMACNLPVVSTSYKALPQSFQAGDGLMFANTEEEFLELFRQIKENMPVVRTREKVQPYSWGNVIAQLEQIYHELLEGKGVDRPFLICFTGIDGSGKTSHAKKLGEFLNQAGVTSKYVWNKYDSFLVKPFTKLGKMFFMPGKDMSENYTDYLSAKQRVLSKRFIALPFLLLFLAEYLFHALVKVKLPAMLGKNIICDRYIYDVIASVDIDFGHFRGFAAKALKSYERFLPKPDLLFLLDLPADIAFNRKDDTISLPHLERLRQAYRQLAEEAGAITLDSEKDFAEVGNLILEKVKALVKESAKKSKNG